MCSAINKTLSRPPQSIVILCLILFLMPACNHFPFRAFVTMICQTSIKVLLILAASLDSAVYSPEFEHNQSFFFETVVLILLVFYLIRSVSAEGSLNCISRTWFDCSFFWAWVNQYMVHGFAWYCTVSGYDLKGSLNRSSLDLAVSSFDIEQIIFDYFACICCLFTTYFSLVILSQISAACSKSWYRKLEFCVTSFWFYAGIISFVRIVSLDI